jgi:hypothetical protein
LPAIEPVGHLPKLRSDRFDKQIGAKAVANLFLLAITRLGGPARSISQHLLAFRSENGSWFEAESLREAERLLAPYRKANKFESRCRIRI